MIRFPMTMMVSVLGGNCYPNRNTLIPQLSGL